MNPAPIAPGDRIGNVIVGERIGEGGFGVVYEGRDVLLDRRVALKVLRERDLGLSGVERERFLREARAVARLDSPHVAVIHHVVSLGDRGLVLEMEHVAGGSLARLLGDGDRLADEPAPPLAAERAIAIAMQVAAALRVSHRQGVVHGDLKPENVLLTPEGSIKLVDFGLAHILGERRLEATGAIPGSPSYMAPEVILGDGVGPASDVWSLGVLLYRMLTGRLPFAATSLPALFFAILSAPPPTMGPLVTPALERLVTRCLSKEPASRPDSVAELPSLLEQVLQGDSMPDRGRDAGPIARSPTPSGAPPIVVGRDAEVARLRANLDTAATGRGQTVLVTGDVGSGKTTLVRWAEVEARARGFRWIEVSLAPAEGLLRPLLEALRRTLAADATAGSVPLDLDTKTFGPAAALLRDLLAAERPPEIESRRTAVWALERLLAELAARRPVALVVEGLHGAEPGEIAILRDLASRLGEHPVWTCLTARSFEEGTGAVGTGALAPLGDVEGVVRLPLAPLDGETLYELVETVLGAPLAADVAREVVARAGGNPLFALELLRQMQATGAIVRTSREVRASETWGRVATPVRLFDLFAARLREFPDAQRELLEVAAIDGVSFDGEALAAVLGRPLLSVLRELQRIARTTGLVVPQSSGFRFAHALLRDVLYDGVAPALRRELHAALAAHLEARPSPADPERIGVHWEGAGNLDRAVVHLRSGLMGALGRHEVVRAEALASRARLLPPALDVPTAREHFELLLRLARGLDIASGHDATIEKIYDTLVQPELGALDPTLPLRARLRRAHYRYFSKGARAVDEFELGRAAKELPLARDRGQASYLLGIIAKFRGDLSGATQNLARAVGCFAEDPRSDSARASALDQLASIERRSGRPEVAATRYAVAADLSDRAGNRYNAAASRVNEVLAMLAAGQVDGTSEILDRAIRTLELEGAPRLVAHAMVARAELLYGRGETTRAIACLDQVLRRSEAAHYLPAAVAARTELAHLSIVVGDVERARTMLRAAEDAATSQEDLGSLATISAYACQWACLDADRRDFGDTGARMLDRLAGLTEPATLVSIALRAVESVLFGFPTAFAADVLGAVARAMVPPDFPAARRLQTLADAYVEFRTPSAGSIRMAAAAEELSRGPLPERPATLRVISDLLCGEAERRSGRSDTADSAFRRGLEAARALGHVMLQRAFETAIVRSPSR